jgi:hypothetical protein
MIMMAKKYISKYLHEHLSKIADKDCICFRTASSLTVYRTEVYRYIYYGREVPVPEMPISVLIVEGDSIHKQTHRLLSLPKIDSCGNRDVSLFSEIEGYSGYHRVKTVSDPLPSKEEWLLRGKTTEVFQEREVGISFEGSGKIEVFLIGTH